MNHIKLLAKESSGFIVGSELFCGSQCYYNMVRFTTESYVMKKINNKPFHVVGKKKNGELNEISRGVVTLSDVEVVTDEHITNDDYSIIIGVLNEKIKELIEKVNKPTDDWVFELTKPIMNDKVNELKEISEKIQRLIQL